MKLCVCSGSGVPAVLCAFGEYTEYVSVCGVFGTDSVDFTLEAIRGHILCAFSHCLVALMFVASRPNVGWYYLCFIYL